MSESYIFLKKQFFLFKELVKRDFKEKYKRTVLGMAWSVLSPLLNLIVLILVFTKLLGRNTPHYPVYIFCGTLVMSYFRESTKGGMRSLVANKKIITKINIPKFLFLLSSNVSSFINFILTILVFLVICIFDKIQFGWHFLLLLIPIFLLMIFNIGIGLLLSACYVFFKDTSYLYDILLTLINYLSAVFYRIDGFSDTVQKLFLCNPLYCFILYFRTIVIYGNFPSLLLNCLCIAYSLISLGIGIVVYKKLNYKLVYYM